MCADAPSEQIVRREDERTTSSNSTLATCHLETTTYEQTNERPVNAQFSEFIVLYI